MAPRQSPTLRRRRLGTELKRIRERESLTVLHVAGVLGWSTTKLSRIEAGVGDLPQLKNVEALLDHYGIHGYERDNAISLTRQARARGWWHPHKGALDAGTYTYLGLEDEASILRLYESQSVPALLQTPAYAAALVRGQQPGISAEDLEVQMYVRSRRQELLLADPPLEFWTIVDEAALRRTVGGPQVMRDQLAYLTQMSAHRYVHIQVLPFSAGAHAGVAPFAILDFAESVDPEVVYLRTVARSLWVEDPADVVKFRLAFEELIPISLTVRQSKTFIEKMLTEFD